MQRVKGITLERTPWVWSAIGAFVLWISIGIIAHRGMIGTIQGNLQIGSYLILVGMGQMLVIASGNGNIDLSIPNVMTLSSLIALSIAGGDSKKLALGIVAGIAAGLLIGLFNSIMIFGFGVPAIVATLASGLLAQSAILIKAETFNAVAPASLTKIVGERFFGVPVIAIFVLLVSIFAAFTLHQSRYGRNLFAVGQSSKAAERAGVPVVRTSTIAYLASGGLSALSGILLSAFTGPSISLGTPFLITSVAVVILGGTPIAGGRGSVAGIWTAMLMLNLIITLVYVLQWSVAIQDIFEGLVILGVLTMAGGRRSGH